MERTHRMWNLFTPAAQRSIEFALIAVVAFLVGAVFAVTSPDLVPFGRPSAAVPAAKVVPAQGDTPIQSAGSSAYDGKRSMPVHGVSASASPIQSAGSSAYDGRPPAERAARRDTTPIRSASSSAYDGK